MLRRNGVALALAGGLAVFVGVASSSCGNSGDGAGLSDTCTINSDCNAPLICAFARCHEACAESRDCPNGERCLIAGGICQLTQESTCEGTATCAAGQECGTDKQCRALCASAADCAQGDFCLPTGATSECYTASNAIDEAALMAAGVLSPDGAVLADGAILEGPEGSTTSPDGSPLGSHDGSVGPTTDAPTGNSCPSAQTQFSSTASGDSNPNFTSGVGARTATQLIAFDSYVGPDPTGDGGSPNIAAIYDQAFDPTSGLSAAPAQLFTAVKNLDILGDDAASAMTIMSSAIAPSGEIALVYSVSFTTPSETSLYAIFLAPGGDGGAGLRVQRTVLLTSATVYVLPYAIWSTTSNAFVFSWSTSDSGQYVTVQKFLANGSPAGGNSTVVPTDSASNNFVVANGNVAQGAVGESQGLFGVAYESAVSTFTPAVTVLDPTGSQVGTSILTTTSAVSGQPLWTAIAGTAQGFVYFFDSPTGVNEIFLPVSGATGIVGGVSDASTFTGFNVPGTVRANYARAVSDSASGAGGVGLALLYASGVSFAYVQADGVRHVGPSPVFPHTYTNGDYPSLTNLNGSFVVSLYTATNHLTQVAASGCTP